MSAVQYKEVSDIAQRAIAIAHENHHEMATLEHILSALLENEDIKKCFNALSVDIEEMSDLMSSFMKAGFIPTTTSPDAPSKSQDFEVLFLRVVGIARFSSRRTATALDVLLNMTQLPHEDSYAVTALLRAGVNSLNVKKYLAHGSSQHYVARSEFEGMGGGADAEPSNKEEAIKYLKKYSADLNQLAKDGKIDPLIGRAEEVDQIVQITARRTKNNCILVGDSGVGKAQPLFSKIVTPTGYKSMGDLKIGDEVVTPKGNVSEITEIFPQGVKSIYQINFKDGRKTHSCNEHLWKVYRLDRKRNGYKTGYRVSQLSEIQKDMSTSKHRFYIPLGKTGGISNKLPLDPYVLGVLLGDGNISGTGGIRFSTADDHIIQELNNRLFSDYEIVKISGSKYDYRIKKIIQNSRIKNRYEILLNDMGLIGTKSFSKFVPDVYKNCLEADRYLLLNGLLDTDGTVTKTGAISFSTSSEKLARDVQSLVWSLGGVAKIRNKKTKYTHNAVKKEGLVSYNVSIRHPEPKKLFSLSRKLDRISDNYQYQYTLKNEIESVEYFGEYEAQCIMIDDADHLYMTDGYIVTHNTAVVEGLALKIVAGEVPEILKDSTIYALDIGSLVAGTRFRGDFEERMKLVLKSLTYLPDSILFIDEIHTIMDAGSGSKGSLDVANLLKPALAKGQLRCIGSTTAEEYRKHIEKDRAIVRRFKKVNIDEPSPEVTKVILRGLKTSYESFHGVTFTDEAIDAAVDLTHKYVTTSLLPDKAIDIIDNAGARQRILPVELRKTEIGAHEIEQEVSRITKIPAKEIAESEETIMIRLDADLKKEVFGQNEAIDVLVDSVFISRAGLRDTKKPAGSYLFVGPTGVGKAQPLYSKIMTPTGWTEMGKISVGDLISIPKGGSAKVIGVFPQGNKPIYRVTFVDGRQAECCDEHLWNVYYKHWKTENRSKVISLSEIRRLLSLKGDYYVPLTKPIEFNAVNLPLDPYFVGAMLGDGNYSGKIIRFSSFDKEILDRVRNALPDGSSLKQYDCNSDCDWNVLGQQFLWPLLETSGLEKGSLSHTKFVPKPYMNGSVEQRLELLRGLMDTDGTVTKTGAISFSTSSAQLAMDVMELVRSLGGTCKLSKRWPTYVHNGKKMNGKESYRLAIRHPEPKKLFHLTRKKARIFNTYQYADLRLKISKIELIGNHESQCIMIDDQDHLYITDDYVVTHNTEMARQLAKSLNVPLVKFDMSEYMEKHSVSKFIGAPPGYVGFGEGGAGNGILVNAIDTNPSCVLLLDEIEKAHDDIFNVLLQVMDDARLTSSGGKTVNFRNVTLIMTSNVGISSFDKNPLGFAESEIAEVDEKAIKNLFRPEFRNRLDSIVKFNRLRPENMVRIVDKFITEMEELSASRNVKIHIEEDAREWLAKEGYDPAMGARPLARVINDNIKKPLSRLMLLGPLKEGGIAVVTLKDGKLSVE